MNDLRILLQIEPNKKTISLQFKQLNSLQPLMPLLSKFEHLQQLSLHGNRLKSLPDTMVELKELTQIDISNNLFHDISNVVESLKTLPHLTHLIMNFKNYHQENFIKNSLPLLQRINKKPIVSNEKNTSISPEPKKLFSVQKLSEDDLEKVGAIYDEIRVIYQNSKYILDRQLAYDFERNVENIMSDLSHKLNGDRNNQTKTNCNIIIGKYSLLDLCFVKLITYFYHFDKKIATVFQKIHDEQAEIFKIVTDLLYNEASRYNVQISKSITKKEELFKAQIKRLKTSQAEANEQIKYLENQNKELLQKLLKYGKLIRLDIPLRKSTNLQSHQVSKSSQFNNPKSSRTHSPVKQNSVVITLRDKLRTLTLNQFKEVMSEIYYSKQKHNIFCIENHQPLQTMEAHMYTYLNQKYGLKSLAIEWAINIVNGIKNFGAEDAEIATFGKILRNQSDEEFLMTLHKIKENFIENYKKFQKHLIQKEGLQITINQSEEVLLCMNFSRDQISTIVSKLKDKAVNNVITVDKLQRALLDHFVKKHDEKIVELCKEFNEVDEDEDGIITIEQFKKLVKVLFPKVDADKLRQLVDPSKRGGIAFFYLCQAFLNHPDLKNQLKPSPENQ